MDGVGAFAIIVAIICGGYLYFDYTFNLNIKLNISPKLVINVRQECKNAM